MSRTYSTCSAWHSGITAIRTTVIDLLTVFPLKPKATLIACTGRLLFSQLSPAVVRPKANDDVVYAI